MSFLKGEMLITGMFVPGVSLVWSELVLEHKSSHVVEYGFFTFLILHRAPDKGDWYSLYLFWNINHRLFFLNIYISMFSRMIKSESSYMPVLIPTSKSTPRTSEIPDVFPYLFNGLLCTFDLISNWVSVIGTSCIKAGLRLSLKVLLKFTNPNIGTVTNSRFTIYLFFFLNRIKLKQISKKFKNKYFIAVFFH